MSRAFEHQITEWVEFMAELLAKRYTRIEIRKIFRELNDGKPVDGPNLSVLMRLAREHLKKEATRDHIEAKAELLGACDTVLRDEGVSTRDLLRAIELKARLLGIDKTLIPSASPEEQARHIRDSIVEMDKQTDGSEVTTGDESDEPAEDAA